MFDATGRELLQERETDVRFVTGKQPLTILPPLVVSPLQNFKMLQVDNCLLNSSALKHQNKEPLTTFEKGKTKWTDSLEKLC